MSKLMLLGAKGKEFQVFSDNATRGVSRRRRELNSAIVPCRVDVGGYKYGGEKSKSKKIKMWRGLD